MFYVEILEIKKKKMKADALFCGLNQTREPRLSNSFFCPIYKEWWYKILCSFYPTLTNIVKDFSLAFFCFKKIQINFNSNWGPSTFYVSNTVCKHFVLNYFLTGKKFLNGARAYLSCFLPHFLPLHIANKILLTQLSYRASWHKDIQM